MSDARLSDPKVFESFGLGALFAGFWVSASSPTTRQLPQLAETLDPLLSGVLAVAFGAVIVFTMYCLGRLCIILGAGISGLTVYRTVLRYEHYVANARSLSERDWALFIGLRRDLEFLDGLLGVFTFGLAFGLLTIVASDEPARLAMLPLAMLGALGCLNGIWQNRLRVVLVLGSAKQSGVDFNR
jgi:hypothetical protein